MRINNPNDANDLGIGMVHQHFKLVQCFSVLDNIILGKEENNFTYALYDELAHDLSKEQLQQLKQFADFLRNNK